MPLAIRDVKGLVIGRDNFRFKAELNWNGAEIARQHLAHFDLETEFKALDSPEKLRELMIRFGAGVIDRNGEEVDRVERAIKTKRLEIKHEPILETLDHALQLTDNIQAAYL